MYACSFCCLLLQAFVKFALMFELRYGDSKKIFAKELKSDHSG